MRSSLLVIFLAISAFGQTATAPSAQLVAACGSKDVSFDVKLGSVEHTPAQPEPGKAQVYFIQDSGLYGESQHYTLKIGLDGAWVGAYKHNSYLTASVEAGERHVCASIQSNHSAGMILALAHFTAEPGKVYYFRTRFHDSGRIGAAPPYVDIDPVDSDEARYLLASYPMSVSQPKK